MKLDLHAIYDSEFNQPVTREVHGGEAHTDHYVEWLEKALQLALDAIAFDYTPRRAISILKRGR